MSRKEGGSAIVSTAPLSTPLTGRLRVAYPRSPFVIEGVRHVRV